MPIAEVDIYNAVMVELGEQANIQSVVELSDEASAITAVYAQVRDGLLRGSEWDWATQHFGPLSALSDDSPEPRYDYWYQIPATCLRVLAIYVEGLAIRPIETVPHARFRDIDQGPVIACNLEDVKIQGIVLLEDPNEWTAEFVDTVTFHLAARVAIPITGSASIRNTMRQEARRSLAQARGLTDEVLPTPPDSTFILGRE